MNNIIDQLKHYQILQRDNIPFDIKGDYKIFSLINRTLISKEYIQNYNNNYYYFKYVNNRSCKDLNSLVIQQAFNVI